MINNLLENLGACGDAQIWAQNKTFKEIFENCERGDWLLWLFARTNPANLKELTLAKAHCANQVRSLMQDDRSKNALDVAIRFGEGLASRDELDAAANAAYAAANAAYAAANAAYAAAYAAYAEAYAAYAAANAAYAAAYAAYAANAAYAAYVANADSLKLSADICRKYLPFELWNIKDEENN